MVAKFNSPALIRAYYRRLHSVFGPQYWWPGRTPFDVIVGAYLTQNTSWQNVDRALCRLRSHHALSLRAIRNLPLRELEIIIQPAGYFRQKAARLKLFVQFVDRQYGGSLRRMLAQPTPKLRQQLLSLDGIGPETADSILAYAGQHPVFVVDTYTRRLVQRHNILPGDSPYEEIRELFERALGNATRSQRGPTESAKRKSKFTVAATAHRPSPMSRASRTPAAQNFNEAHALIVAVGKHYCFKSNPDCKHCPLQTFLPEAQPKQSGFHNSRNLTV